MTAIGTPEADSAPHLARNAADAGFWAGLDDGELRLPRCAGCDRWVWPAEWRCASCGTFGLRWTGVAATGTVWSWTRTWYPFVDERADDLPYVVVVVELAHAGGSRLLGVLRGDETGLACGATVTGRIEPASARTLGLPSVVWELTPGAVADR